MAEIEDYNYPHIDPIDYIDESLDKILARDDSSKHGFRRLQTFPIVSEDDIGMEVYIVGKGKYKLIAYDAGEPTWKQLTDDKRNAAYIDWVQENYQPISNVLSSLSKLTDSSNAIIYFTGPENVQASAISPTGLALIAGTPETIRSQLSLGNVALLSTPIDGSYIKDGTLSMSKIDTTFKNNMGFSTGDVKLTYKATADEGWVMVNDGSIGNTGSGATTRANKDTEALFKLMWNYAACTVQTYAGAASSKTTAIADWNANKRLVLPKVLGRALGVAGSGDGLTERDLGATVGSESITLTTENVPPHSHAGLQVYEAEIGTRRGGHGKFWGSPPGAPGVKDRVEWTAEYSLHSRTDYDFTVITDKNGKAINSSGTNTSSSFDNLQPTSFLNLMIKL